MNEREELAGLLFTTDNSKAVSPWSEWEHCKQEPRLSEYVYAMADALIQAGYRRPRTITTVEELDALGRGATILESNGCVWVNDGQSEDPWGSFGEDPFGGPIWSESSNMRLPVTVLHEPQP